MLKRSRQREAIKHFLMTRKDHPTADVVYSNLKADFPNISLGTVYRNLNLLTSLGEIRKITSGDEADHFDGDTSLHYHFYCENCQCILDLETLPGQDLSLEIGKNFDGMIKGHSLFFYGLCGTCLQSQKIARYQNSLNKFI